MFTTPLSKLDSTTLEYHISSGLIDKQFANILPLDEFIQSEENIHTILTNLNLQLYSEPNENLFSESSNIM